MKEATPAGIAEQSLINYDNEKVPEIMAKTKRPAAKKSAKKEKPKQVHISIYCGYDDKGRAIKKQVEDIATKRGKKTNGYIWLAIEKESGVKFTREDKDEAPGIHSQKRK